MLLRSPLVFVLFLHYFFAQFLCLATVLAGHIYLGYVSSLDFLCKANAEFASMLLYHLQYLSTTFSASGIVSAVYRMPYRIWR
jgi:hypothetical protein